MQPLALMFVLCGLVISSKAAADQTCKAKATEQRLAGAALFSFVKRCEVDAQMACAEAAHKMLAEPASGDFIHTCVVKAIGTGLDGACHTIVATTPTARVALVVTFAGLASADNRVAEPDALIHSWHPIAFSEHPSAGPQDAQRPTASAPIANAPSGKRTDCKRARRLSGRLQGDAHLAPMVSWARHRRRRWRAGSRAPSRWRSH